MTKTRPVARVFSKRWAFAALSTIGATLACGSTASSPNGSCPAGAVSCAGCAGGAFCAPECPAVACPMADAGSSSDATGDAGAAQCPTTAPVLCADCSGGAFCVAGACPAIACPAMVDGGASDGPADGAASDGPTDGPKAADARPDGPKSCNSNADCTGSNQCYPGGQYVGCGGACPAVPNPCSVDSDCQLIHDAAPARPMVCGPRPPCTCSATGTGSCIAACESDSNCGTGEVCASGHCVAKPCTSDADCPMTGIQAFACFSGGCGIKPCTLDTDCRGAFCVNGACSSQQGVCSPFSAPP